MSVLLLEDVAFSFVTPLPMSLNHAYRTVVTEDGRTFRPLTEEAKAYKQEIFYLAKSAANEAGWQYAKGMQLELILHCFFPNKRRRDVSNRLKLLEDALSDAFGFDDSWTTIQSVSARGWLDKANPRGVVYIRELRL